MSNKSFQYDFSKEKLIDKTEKAISDYEDEIKALSSIRQVTKKDGFPYMNWKKNFVSDICDIHESSIDSNWIEISYIAHGQYKTITLYTKSRNSVILIWENIQTTILNKQNYLKQQEALLDEINDPESVCGKFVDNLVNIKDTYRKMGDNKEDNSTERALYYALYDYLG